MIQSDWQTKKQIVEIGTRIWQKGFCAGNEGNHSVRISEDRVLCTPTGISKGFLAVEDICLVDMDGEMAEPNTRGRQRTSEVKVHLAIYKHRPDVKAVIHSHPPHATAFAMSGIALPQSIHPEAEIFLGHVPTAPYATPSTDQLPQSIVALIGKHTNSVLMGNHGTVNFSTDLISTYYKLEILDAYCRILILTKQIGQVQQLNRPQMRDLLEVKQQFGMEDDRDSCVMEGCAHDENDPFIAMFDVRPQTATCNENGDVQGGCDCGCGECGGGEDAAIKAITDQVLASMS
jgi:L-fuculose-phosphate aldolase